MSLPTGNDVQSVDQVLTNMLVAYMQAESRFVADRAFPGVSTDEDSGTYYIFSQKYWTSDEAAVRAYGQEYPRAGFGTSTDTFSTVQYALSKPIADEEEANNQMPMTLEAAAIRYLGMKAMLRKERMFAADFMATSVWGTDKTDATKWSDYAASDPVGDMRTAKRTISQTIGMEPNVAVMGEIVEDRLMNHPDIIDRIKYTERADAAALTAALAAVFGLSELLVGKAIYNSANEGQSASHAAIIDDDCLVMYRTPTPMLLEPSAGYTFNWAPGGGLGSILPIVREDAKDSNLVKMKLQIDQKAVSSDSGYFFSDVTD
jgi:hypothetical protein